MLAHAHRSMCVRTTILPQSSHLDHLDCERLCRCWRCPFLAVCGSRSCILPLLLLRAAGPCWVLPEFADQSGLSCVSLTHITSATLPQHLTSDSPPSYPYVTAGHIAFSCSLALTIPRQSHVPRKLNPSCWLYSSPQGGCIREAQDQPSDVHQARDHCPFPLPQVGLPVRPPLPFTPH